MRPGPGRPPKNLRDPGLWTTLLGEFVDEVASVRSIDIREIAAMLEESSI
jgi:hypothetical protein